MADTSRSRLAELPLEAPPTLEDAPLLPARMVNEFAYCPRLAYLEWVQGEWAESSDTVKGAFVHRRVDQEDRPLPPPDDLEGVTRPSTRSVTISSTRLGLIAKIDLVESDGSSVSPVDYKAGKRPHIAASAYLPERVQLCVQGLLLEENGYRCEAGIIYYSESRERVVVPFDEELRTETRSIVGHLRLVAESGRIPPPLRDSPKCPRCSLVGICLPDEVNHYSRAGTRIRPISVRHDEAMPLYVQAHNARISKRAETLIVSEDDGTKTKAALPRISQVVVMGNAQVTTPCIHELFRRGIPLSWHSYGGWFLGHSVGVGHKNIELREAQYRVSFSAAECLAIAKSIVDAKIRNSRTILRRNWKGDEQERDKTLTALDRLSVRARFAPSIKILLGIEGEAASIYFAEFASLLKKRPDGDAEGIESLPEFQFRHRNRRPPRDPVNALLSFAYSMLTRMFTTTLSAIGFDVYRGFYHQPRYGRPALSLDLMEPFRSIVADSTVLLAVNGGQIRPDDFVSGGNGTALKPVGRKKFIAAFEQRLSQETTHPHLGYQLSMRRLIELQGRLFARHLQGEIKTYPHYLPR